MPYKVLFAGTPEFATYFLRSLINDKRFFVSWVISGLDRRVWRWHVLTSCPVKNLWLENNINVFEPESKDELIDIVKRQRPDIFVVVAYWMILPIEVLNLTKFNINVHWSILPSYRWASPIQASLLAWEKETWISIMNIEQKMDCWDVWKVLRCTIDESDDFLSLSKKLTDMSSEFPDILEGIVSWKLTAKPQDHKAATYCKKINKSDWLIDFNTDDSHTIVNKIKAFRLWPWVYTKYLDKKLGIIEAKVWPKHEGEMWEVFEKWWWVFIKTIDWSIQLVTVKLEWKRETSIYDFVRWHKSFIGYLFASWAK